MQLFATACHKSCQVHGTSKTCVTGEKSVQGCGTQQSPGSGCHALGIAELPEHFGALKSRDIECYRTVWAS